MLLRQDESVLACAHNKDDDKKTKTTTNDCGGIMGKSKQVDILQCWCS
jgi:hypothetical protein